MNTTLNFILIAIVILCGIILFALKLKGRSREVEPKDNTDKRLYTMEQVALYVKETINNMGTTNIHDLGLSKAEFERRKRKQSELEFALKNCNTGDLNNKTYVKEFIFDLLAKTYDFNEVNINYPIPFNDVEELTSRDKFDILLHIYKKKHGFDGLSILFDKYELAAMKQVIEDGVDSFIVTNSEISSTFEKEIYNTQALTFEDKLQIITQRIYAHYKGFGVIDEIRDMNIDGVSGGVSGLPPSVTDFDEEKDLIDSLSKRPSVLESIWVMYKGKTIHLSFLTFGKESELRRVVQSIHKFKNPGQLSESNPYIVNEMADGSRVVVVRPNFAESYAFFIRKFDLPSASLESLIQHENSELVIKLLKFLMAGCRVTGITGSQGSGKTTLLMALVKYIPAPLTLRLQEMAFELNIRKIYPQRNILSFQETKNVTGQEGLDIQKKTDGSVNILGEVATDAVAAWMIQMSQVASLFTVFTHHANTHKLLIESLRNSLLKSGMFNNEKIAEEQVINVVNFDIHLKRDYHGNRYIERITECIPLDNDSDYPQGWKDCTTESDRTAAMYETMSEFFRRMTDRRLYESRNIIEFREGKYVPVHPISDAQLDQMSAYLSRDQMDELTSFFKKYWEEVA